LKGKRALIDSLVSNKTYLKKKKKKKEGKAMKLHHVKD
jgi:hypothetical protein